MLLDIKYFGDFDTEGLSKNKQRKINREIKKYLFKAKLEAPAAWRFAMPPVGDTGKLKESLDVGRVKGNADIGFELNIGIDEIQTTGKPAEWKYPLYVEHGTREKITSNKPNGWLGLRNKRNNFVFTKKRSVSGQAGQYYFERFKNLMKTRAIGGIYTYNLTRKIAKIIAE
jgi:hypothetical protein